MKLNWERVALLCAIGTLGTLGCAGKSANGAPAAAPSAMAPATDEAMAGLLEHHRYHHHGGVTLFIAMSLDTLGVADAKRAAVQKIQADLRAHLQPALAADQKLVATLADGVAASNVDGAKVDAALSDVVVAAGLVRDASTDALNQLHALLDPAERAALIDKVEAHWAVWQSANAEDNATTTSDESHLAVLASDLGLSDAQVANAEQRLGPTLQPATRVNAPEMSASIKKFGDAFRGESFDAHTFTAESGPNGADARMAGWGAAYLAHLIEALSPELTPEQRTKLSERLRAHAGHDPQAQVSP